MACERHHYLNQGQKRLSRAINANGEGVDLLVQTLQNAIFAERVLKRLTVKWGEGHEW